MKCPRCGYFNLPDAPTCGRCQASLVAADNLSGDFDTFQPPRARNRTLTDRVRAPLRQAAARFGPPPVRLTENPLPMGELQSLISGLDFRPWMIASAGVIPGAGHLVLREWLRAGAFLGAAAVLLTLLVLLIRYPFSDILAWGLLALSVYSVWDAADKSFPRHSDQEEAHTLRAVRLLAVSIGIVAGTFVAVSLLLGRWYDLWVFRSDQAAPAFLSGDGLVVRRLASPDRALRRGDAAVYFRGDGYLAAPLTERVVGLPGDQIAGQGNTLWVNRRPVPPERLPFTFRTPVPPFSVVVPDGQVCLWRGVNAQNADETEGAAPAPYLLVSADRIQGRAVALYQPPARRRWFR